MSLSFAIPIPISGLWAGPAYAGGRNVFSDPDGSIFRRLYGNRSIGGTILMTLVPKDEPMRAEVWVGNLDAGFVQAGQAAKLKLATYPFQEYGMVEGAVIHMSPDATEGSDPAAKRLTPADAGEPPTTPAGYRTLVALKTSYLEAEGQRYRLSPGMQVTAEIHLGTRTVLEYLLSPVQKTVREAARER